MTNTTTFEQPLNELIRVCLRLEHLFQQIDHYITDTSVLGSRNMVALIIQVLQLLDRPDLKAKLAKELTHHIGLLKRLSATPDVNKDALKDTLEQLNFLSRCFIDSNGKIGQQLREIDLLSNLRLHLSTSGGGCCFDIPIYHSWLQENAETRLALIKKWIGEFDNIRLAVELILQLVREGAKTQEKTASKGFFQDLLDHHINLKLVRVCLPNIIKAFPEISIGRHYLSVRFYLPSLFERPTQHQTDINFLLAYCIA